MKPSLLFLAVLFLTINEITAQDPITVSGSCFISDALGVYTAQGVINDKPRYIKGDITICSTFTSQALCEDADVANVYDIRWDGAKWIWTSVTAGSCQWISTSCGNRSSGQIFATNANDTPLPPCLGWVDSVSGCVPELSASGCNTLGIFVNTFSDDFTFYPNPTIGRTTIDFGNLKKRLSVNLNNIYGQTIWTKNFKNSSSIQLDIDQPVGVYFLEIKGAKGENALLKVIKE